MGDKCCDEVIDARLRAPNQKILNVVSLVLINKDNKVLLAQRPEGKDMAGIWEFPGGKVEKGETLHAAMIREAKEEINVDICAGCLVPLTFAAYSYENFYLNMPIFACRNYKGTPIGNEGQNIIWEEPNQLHKHQLPPATKEIIGIVRDFLM